MQLLDTRTYIAELAAAGRRHNVLLTLFKRFSELGVIHVSDVSIGDSGPSPFWSIHFNETGEVQDIEPRRNEGAYNVGSDTDAAEIVLAAIHKLISKPSGPEALAV
jgi:hypothetical protein